MALIAAGHALSRSESPPRFTDPDLIALEKVAARAKRAMDAFVLRPRVPDSYDSICSGCLGEGRTSLSRVARPAIGLPHDMDAVSAMDAPRLRQPKYASLSPSRPALRVGTLRQRIALRKSRLRRNVGFSPWPGAAVSWDTELRR